jgi:hypothetical protein
MAPDLLAALTTAVAPGDVLPTISLGNPNEIADIDEAGVLIETDASKKSGKGPQLVPAWMLNLGWRHLQVDGTVTNRHLLNDHIVRRSSAVCTLLAALPDVEVVSSKPIVLRLRR